MFEIFSRPKTIPQTPFLERIQLATEFVAQQTLKRDGWISPVGGPTGCCASFAATTAAGVRIPQIDFALPAIYFPRQFRKAGLDARRCSLTSKATATDFISSALDFPGVRGVLVWGDLIANDRQIHSHMISFERLDSQRYAVIDSASPPCGFHIFSPDQVATRLNQHLNHRIFFTHLWAITEPTVPKREFGRYLAPKLNCHVFPAPFGKDLIFIDKSP